MSGPGVDRLSTAEVREALRLLGHREPPTGRAAAVRSLREELRAHGVVRGLIDRAPEPAGDAFARLASEGPLEVEALLGRGWWGHGALPAPLDWLQRRALVQVGDDGLVHATAEAREGFAELTLWDPGEDDEDAEAEAPPVGVRVEAVASVVVAPDPSVLERAMGATGPLLRMLAPTVAVSTHSAAAVTAALRAAGVPLHADAAVPSDAERPALPGTPEEAVGPRAVRALIERGVSEGRQLRLQYFASSRGGAATDRVVDPWSFQDDLLVGYCHLRQDERSFAVDRIGRATLLPSPVQVPPR